MTPYTHQLMNLPRYATDGAKAIHPGFDRIKMLLDGMGHPEKHLSVALIGGTNGKGSTASMMAACLSASGIRTGLHTSPHLLHVRERMRVDGLPPPAEWLEAQVQTYWDLFKTSGASFFEATFALSLCWFAFQGATHAVVEVGLGGRLDATNVLDADISVITGVALDHMDLLGDTLPLIATEKAGIIKAEKTVVLGKMPCEARSAIESVARQRKSLVLNGADAVSITQNEDGVARISTDSRLLERVHLQFSGDHQLSNTACALAAIDQWIPGLPDEALISGLENVSKWSGLRARTEKLRHSPLVMVDVGHNPDALTNAFDSFLSAARRGNAVLVLGLLNDKDALEIGRCVQKVGLAVCTVPLYGVRGQSENQLSEALKSAGVENPKPFSSVQAALDFVTKNDLDCLIAGSHVVAAEAITYFSEQRTV